MERIKRNAIRCKHCGEIIESRHTHDFQVCKCGRCFVDGGLEYLRWGGEPEDYEDLAEVEEDRPIEALESMRQAFIKENGRLLTEDEAIEFIDEMKKDLYRKGILNHEN